MIHPFMLSAVEERSATEIDDDEWEVEGANAAPVPMMDARMASFILGYIFMLLLMDKKKYDTNEFFICIIIDPIVKMTVMTFHFS